MSPRENARNIQNGAHGLNCMIFVKSWLIFEIDDENYIIEKISLQLFWNFHHLTWPIPYNILPYHTKKKEDKVSFPSWALKLTIPMKFKLFCWAKVFAISPRLSCRNARRTSTITPGTEDPLYLVTF